jgi:hypothetical protein
LGATDSQLPPDVVVAVAAKVTVAVAVTFRVCAICVPPGCAVKESEVGLAASVTWALALPALTDNARIAMTR